jgi:hypothetical protein
VALQLIKKKQTDNVILPVSAFLIKKCFILKMAQQN